MVWSAPIRRGGACHDHHAGAQVPGVGGTGQAHVARPLDHDRHAGPEACLPEPVDHVGERLEEGQLLGADVVGEPHQLGAGQDRHVLAVAAPQTFGLVEAERVAVAAHTERVAFVRFAEGDDVDRHAVADSHAEVGVGTQGLDTADNLVAGHGR